MPDGHIQHKLNNIDNICGQEHEDVAEHSDTIPLTKHDESDQDKELDHGDGLSFSDSLGMESADFEVGTHAKRKLERSRLSLSSLNSEKFAVNTIAVEESEQLGSVTAVSVT